VLQFVILGKMSGYTVANKFWVRIVFVGGGRGGGGFGFAGGGGGGPGKRKS